MKYKRIRFTSTEEDYRPVKYPPPFPWWCSGYDSDDNAILIAYLPNNINLKEYFPEVESFEVLEETNTITYTGRFPKPDWMS